MTSETEPTPPEIILTDPAYWAENIDALREALAATSGDTVEPPIETPTPRSNVSVRLRVPARWLDEPEGLVEAVNLPALTDGASVPSVWLGLLGIAVLTPPRPTGPAPRGWWMIGLAFARSTGSLPTRPGSGRYSGLWPCGTAPCGVRCVGRKTSARRPGDT